MLKKLAQPVFQDEAGRIHIENDWFGKSLPANIFLDEMSYPDTSYSYASFYSRQPVGLSLGYASGIYGNGQFTTGRDGVILVGKFVVLQGTGIICNKSITIGDHCMFSWGSIITDSWLDTSTFSLSQRRKILENAASTNNRHIEYPDPKPVIIEENVWVGFESIILPGVRIGRGAVIGCKTIVTGDVPPYAVAVGNPYRVIKYLEPTDTREVKEKALSQFGAKLN